MLGARAILLWLMMLAVPFQAFAAAAMVACAPGSPMAMHSQTGERIGHHDHGHHAMVASDHAADHVDPQAHTHQHGAVAADDHQDHAAAHKCGNCAPCHAVGPTPAMAEIRHHGLPQAELAEPIYALANFSPDVPHKPPRV